MIGPGVMAYACSVIYNETTMKQVTVCEIQIKLNFFTNSSYLGFCIIVFIAGLPCSVVFISNVTCSGNNMFMPPLSNFVLAI